MRILISGAIIERDGHEEWFCVSWCYPDFPLAVEAVVNWRRDGLLTIEQGVMMIESVKRINDEELKRTFETSTAGRTGHTQGRFAPRAGGGV